MKNQSLIIRDLEQSLGARYVCDLVSGHMGTTLVRMQGLREESFSVAKFCPVGAPQSAFMDFQANIHGYVGIRKAGVENLLPTGYRVLQLHGTPVIVMDDLGENLFLRFKSDKEAVPKYCAWLCNHFKRAVISSLKRDETGVCGTDSLKDVLGYITLYTRDIHVAPEATRNMISALTKRKVRLPSKYVALCLLDFTPSNLFVSKERVAFIDPWEQKSYLGNSAISIGQFVTLVRSVHKLANIDEGAEILLNFALQELPNILGCTKYTAERALNLGSTLQLVLSSYVRRESEPALAAKLMAQAHGLWT